MSSSSASASFDASKSGSIHKRKSDLDNSDQDQKRNKIVKVFRCQKCQAFWNHLHGEPIGVFTDTEPDQYGVYLWICQFCLDLDKHNSSPLVCHRGDDSSFDIYLMDLFGWKTGEELAAVVNLHNNQQLDFWIKQSSKKMISDFVDVCDNILSSCNK